jgi:hypothetical protein
MQRSLLITVFTISDDLITQILLLRQITSL